MLRRDPRDIGSDVLATSNNYHQLRLKMVETQIRARGVRDKKVLAAMGKVPRHEFVSKAYRGSAYIDDPPVHRAWSDDFPALHCGLYDGGAKLKGGEKVLEIGTGSGYQAAVLAELSAAVYTIEIIKSLAKEASRRLK